MIGYLLVSSILMATYLLQPQVMALLNCGALHRMDVSLRYQIIGTQVSSGNNTVLLHYSTLIVWSCGWHWSGGLLATASMDHCCKLWDIERYW